MVKKKLRKILATMLCLIMAASTLAGCGNGEQKPAPSEKPNTEQPKQIEQKLVYNIATDPASIDPAINEAVDGGIVIAANYEGLTRLNDDATVKPGVAEKWEISSDGLVYTFHLRQNAKWSDGQGVKAGDFEYAWKRALDPKTGAAYSMFFTDYVKNAAEYFAGNAKWEDVGIKVKDDYTIEVTLKVPTAFYLELVSQPVYMPLRKDMVEKDPEKWTQNGDTYIGNGPFKMVKWTHNDSFELVKNENYWDAASIKLQKLTFVMVNDQSSALTSWDSGEIDVLDSLPASEIPRLLDEGKITKFPYLSCIFVYLNNNNKALADKKVRKALQLSIERENVVKAVTRGGENPAYAFVSPGVKEPDQKTEFRDKGGDLFKQDIEQAKKLLAEAGYPDGKGFPQITYLYNTSEYNKKIAEALQDMWKRNLGIDVKLENIEWKVFLERRRKLKNYDMARGSWVGDYMDPMTFLAMFKSDSRFNDPSYKNPEYDKIITQAEKETNLEKRSELLHQAEKMIMDDAVIVPIFFPYTKLLMRPGVKGVYSVPTGANYFDHAYVDETVK